MAKEKHIVTTFGRMNPPTTGHQKLIDKVLNTAKSEKADHNIHVSHSVDAKKNPLTPERKVHHLKKMFPGVNITHSTKEAPNLFQHLKDLHEKGYTHVTFVAGSDRVPEYEEKIKKYNKPESEGGLYNFKHIKVVSAGHRDPDAEGTEGISASKMRSHAQEGNYHSFKAGLPKHVTHEHAQEIYNDVRKGMNIKESVLMRFKNWLVESTNISSGLGIRGLGDITGTPGGSVNKYAAVNAQSPELAKDMVQQHYAMHDDVLNASDADTKDSLIRTSKTKKR